MPVRKNKMEDWKLLSFLALLSNYDYFSVQKEQEPEFFATGIERSCGWVLKFARKFATPKYSDGELTNVSALSETEFDCRFGDFTYHIRALHEKPKSIPNREEKNWKGILDLADIEYINAEKCQYVKELDMLVLVIDSDLLGELTVAEESQIKRIINVYLHGQGNAMQMCRSVCFEIKLHDPQDRIYAGMFDLEHSVPVTSVMVYNRNLSDTMNETSVQRYTALRQLAYKLYNEKFSS